MSTPEDDLTVHLRHNAERGWIDMILGARSPDDADTRLGAEGDELKRRLDDDLTLHEALAVQDLLADLEALRTDLRRVVVLRRSPPPEPPEPPATPENGPEDELPPSGPPDVEEAPEPPRRSFLNFDFLGRGVSGRLNDLRASYLTLTDAGLPLLGCAADLANALGLSMRHLRWLAFHTEVATRIHYVHFTVAKKSGGTRTLSAPHRMLAGAQRWIFDNILSKLETTTICHGFVPGRGIVSNALVHVGQDVVVNMDLEGFFPSIGFPRVRKVFELNGYSPALSTILALLCTECPRRAVTYAGKRYWVATGQRCLPQGACTRPALSNQVARRLDKRLMGLTSKLGLRHTRYADDLTFSGPADFEEKIGYLLARVRHLALDEGFKVNEKKTRVMRRNAAQKVTGLVVNDRPGVPRHEVRRLRAILHRARTEGLEKQNREGRPNFRAWLRGKIAYVKMARPEVGARLLAELRAVTAGREEAS